MIFHSEFQTYSETAQAPPQIEGLADPALTVYQALARALTPPPAIDYVKWAEENVVFDADNRFPGPYNSDLFPFFKKVLRCLQPDHPSHTVVLMGSAQCGKTITANVFTGATLERQPGGFMYVMPTIDTAGVWVREKWQPFANGTACLKKLFPREKSSRDKTNKLLYKERVDGFSRLRVTGANSASSLASASYRCQVQDELGKWEENEYGDPEHQANMRSKSWGPWAKLFKISTPGVRGICRITKNYERSNRQKYHVPCPHCGFKHPLEWDNFKLSLKEGMDFSEAHFTCPDCGGVIEHHHKEGMLRATLDYDGWVAENPESDIEGFYIWTAYSPLEDWAYIARHYFDSLGDPRAEQTFTTETVGLPYEQKGDSPPWQEIAARALDSDYVAGTIPNGAPLLTMACDVQGDRVEWLVKAWGPCLRRWTVQRGVIDGHISDERVQQDLDNLIKRKWKNQQNNAYPIDIMAIDANWETNEVKTWAKRHSESKVITIKGAREYTAPPMVLVKDERRNSGKILSRQKRHWLVGVSGMKASLYKNLEKTDPLARGYCGFPKDIGEDYFQQLCSEKRVMEADKKTRATRFIWVRVPQYRNEILDMENYNEAAARRWGWHTMSDEQWEALLADRERTPPDMQMDLLEPNLMLPQIPKQGVEKTSISSQLA